MFPFLAAILGAVKALKRRCPKCGREQIVPRSEMHRSVKCKFCGVEIPPKSR